MEKVTLNLVKNEQDKSWECQILVNDDKLIGKKATLDIDIIIDVKQSGGHDAHISIYNSSFILQNKSVLQTFSSKKLDRAYSYQGTRIDIKISTKLKIDDGIIFDTNLSFEPKIELYREEAETNSSQDLVNLKDKFSLMKNFSALPAENKKFIVLVCGTLTVMLIINTLVGIHDQFSLVDETFFYRQKNSLAFPYPILNAGILSIIIGAILWATLRYQLGSYLKIKVKGLPLLDKNSEIDLSELVEGTSSIQLDNCIVRVVAYNIELGTYTSGSGKNKSSKSFRTPSRSILLFEEQLPTIRANTPIESYLSGKIATRKIFDCLYPTFLFSKVTGIEIAWQLQIIHEDLIDFQINLDSNFKIEDFYKN